jgi:hypothetical protein
MRASKSPAASALALLAVDDKKSKEARRMEEV